MATKKIDPLDIDDPLDRGAKFKNTVVKVGAKQRAAAAKVQKYTPSRYRRARSGLSRVRVV